MNISYNQFGQYKTPVIILCNPSARPVVDSYGNVVDITNTLGVLGHVKDLNFTFNYNAISEVSFNYDLAQGNDEETTSLLNSLYNEIVLGRYLYFGGIGFFQISSAAQEEGDINTKSITANSCDVEMEACSPPLIAEQTTDGDSFGVVSFEKLVSDYLQPCCLNWKFIIDNDAELKALQRTFDTKNDDYTGQSLYQFIFETVQDKYEVASDIDYIRREVTFYSRTKYAVNHATDIYLAKRSLLDKITTTAEDEVYTAIKVSGGNDLNLSLVYPLGGNIVYDFTAKLDWMSDALREKVENWQDFIAFEMGTDEHIDPLSYAYYIRQWISQQDDVNQKTMELDTAIKAVKNAETVFAEAIKNGSSPKAYNEALDALNKAKKARNTANKALKAATAEAEETQKNLNKISERCQITNYFTSKKDDGTVDKSLLKELEPFIKVCEYSDENTTQTDGMTYAQKQKQQMILYQRAVEQLKKIIVGEKKFSVESSDILFNEQFKAFAEQLKIGAIIHIETNQNPDVQLHLITLGVDFEQHKATLTFGNQYIQNDMKSLFNYVFSSMKKSQSSLKYVEGIIEQQKDENAYLRSCLEDTFTLTLQNVIQSQYQDFVIDSYGILGRRLLYEIDPTTGKESIPKIDANTGEYEYDPRQIRMINEGLYITKDGWKSLSVAIGRLQVGNTEAYGVAADLLIGKVLIGEQLNILGGYDELNNVYNISMGENGIVITNTANSHAGIKIRQEADDGYEDVFYVDENGKLKVGSWRVGGNWLYTSQTNSGTTTYTVLKSGGYVAFAAGVPEVSFNNKTTDGAALQIFHSGKINMGLDQNSTDTNYALTVEGNKIYANHEFYSDVGLTLGFEKVGNEIRKNATIQWNGDSEVYLQKNHLQFVDDSQVMILTPSYLQLYMGRLIMSPQYKETMKDHYYIAYYGAEYGNDMIALCQKDTLGSGEATGRYATTFKITKTGDITGKISSSSDKRVKHSIEDLPSKYSTLFDSLRPVRYKYNDGTSNRYHTGFIADEVKECIKNSDLTTQDLAAYIEDTNSDEAIPNTKRLRYDEFIAIIVNEVQKLKAELKQMKEVGSN